MNRLTKKKRSGVKTVLLVVVLLFVVVCWQNLKAAKEVPALQDILAYVKEDLYAEVFDTHMPVVMAASKESEEQPLFREYIWEKLTNILPIHEYTMNLKEYDTQIESQLTYEMLMAREGIDEQYRDGERIAEAETGTNSQSAREKSTKEGKDTNGKGEKSTGKEAVTADTGAFFTPVAEPVVKISREKLNDFDYLIQHFYVVDKTTTIDSSQLNATELLAMDMKLKTTADKPQILIHHTHSQEGYVDSNGDPSTSIVGVGAYLAKLLREQYGLNVIHDTGEYDVIDHQDAYSYAGPAIEQILAENPSIEVVIDIHRDGIKEGHLVSEVNGKQTAQIMFFNGLSRTTSNGDLDYLHNPYIKENLAFSLQMKLAAEEYYPGFARANYLKGYRYNLHYSPKSMLVEVGAQTNTVQEAMNAMEPLADLLYKVLTQ